MPCQYLPAGRRGRARPRSIFASRRTVKGCPAPNQIIRQAVVVVVTVPGPRHPALVVGDATYEVVAERAIVSIAVENTGNVRLKPIVAFILSDAKGVEVNRSSVTMDSLYAHTATFVELPLATLSPGAYSVRLTLDDPAQAVRADEAAIGFIVAAPAQPTPTDRAGTGLTEDIQAIVEGRMSPPAWAIVGLGCIAPGSVAGAFALIARRRHGRTTSGR